MFNFQFLKSNFQYLLFGFLMTFCSSFGQTFFLGIFNSFIREDLNLSHSEFGGIYSAATRVSSLTIVWLGKKIDDFKLRNFAIFVCISLFFAAVFMSRSCRYDCQNAHNNGSSQSNNETLKHLSPGVTVHCL